MEVIKDHWIDLGNLAIGVGTIFLAIVVLIVNTRSSNRNRLSRSLTDNENLVQTITYLVWSVCDTTITLYEGSGT